MKTGRRYEEKLLPNQDFFRNMYTGPEPYERALHQRCTEFAGDYGSVPFDLTFPTEVGFEEMSTPPYQLSFFASLIAWRGVRRILEIGTFIGHSTMRFCQMMGPEGRVTTVEVYARFAEIARENFRRNGFSDRIDLREGQAENVLKSLDGKYDLIFVDGAKQSYPELIELSVPLLSGDGTIVVDDVFFHGDALNEPPTSEKGAGCRKVLDRYRDDARFRKLLLPVGNGLLVLYKAV